MVHERNTSPRMIITRITFFVTAAGLLLAFAVSDSRAMGVLRHSLDVTLNLESHEISGTDTLTLRTGDATELSLVLAPNAQVREVRSAGREVRFAFNSGRLSISLPARIGEEPVLRLQVHYAVVFGDRAPAHPLNHDDPTYGVLGSISQDGVFLLPESGWYPELPGSMPLFRIRVRAPKGFDAVTSGKRVDRRTKEDTNISVWETSYPLEGLALCAGRYVVREALAGEIPVYTYFYPENDALADSYLEAAVKYIQFYSQLFGSYAFEKFAVVENFFPTGYGFPSFTLLGSQVIRLPFILGTSLPHEIAHCWWGNGVLVASDSGNWSEGLTTYVSDYLLKEKESPQKAYEYRLNILRDYANLVGSENDIPLAHFKARFNPALRAVGYGKSAMVFHMVRKLVGEEPFWEGLREIYRLKRFQYASWKDFAVIFGNKSNRDLEGFFDQWVDRSGAPFLSLDKVQSERIGDSWVVSGRLLQEEPPYDMKVPLVVKAEEKALEQQLDVNQTETNFSMRSVHVPASLEVDPDADLFRLLYPAEIPPCVNSVKGSRALVVVISEGVPPRTAESSRRLLMALGLSGARFLNEAEAESVYETDADVLFIGIPQRKQLRPEAPIRWKLDGNGFVVEGKRFDDPGDLLFTVFRHPRFERRVVAVYYPLSEEAAVSALGKIPHYGKYGYLVFSNGRNEIKGVWPAHASPLTHVFN